MTAFLRGLAWTGLGVSALAAAGLGFLFLMPYWHLFRTYGPGLGPRVHGWELLIGLLYCGIPGAVFLVLGWAGALGLRARAEPYFLHIYGKFTLGLLAFAAALLAIDYVLPLIGQRIYARQEKSRAETEAVLADRDRFAAFIAAAKDLDAPPLPDGVTPLEQALTRGYPDLAKTLVERGAAIYERTLEIPARAGDADMAVYLWTHAKGLTGRDALRAAFVFGQRQTLDALLGAGVQADPLLREICAREFMHPSPLGEPDWEVLYPPALKGKGLAQGMVRTLARHAADKSGAGARTTLKLAVFTLHAETLRLVLDSGFDAHALDGELSETALVSRDPEAVKALQDLGEDLRSFDLWVQQAPFPRYAERTRAVRELLARAGVRWKDR